jgi:hypothetical protein
MVLIKSPSTQRLICPTIMSLSSCKVSSLVRVDLLHFKLSLETMWFVISYLNYEQWCQLNPQELEEWCALGHYAYGKFQVQGIDQAKLHMALATIGLPISYLYYLCFVVWLVDSWNCKSHCFYARGRIWILKEVLLHMYLTQTSLAPKLPHDANIH